MLGRQLPRRGVPLAVRSAFPEPSDPGVLVRKVASELYEAKFNEIMNISSLKRQLFTLLGREDSTESFALLTN